MDALTSRLPVHYRSLTRAPCAVCTTLRPLFLFRPQGIAQRVCPQADLLRAPVTTTVPRPLVAVRLRLNEPP